MEVKTNTFVKDYDGKSVLLADGKTLATDTLIWAAGIKGNPVHGLGTDIIGRGGRLKVDRFNRVENHSTIFAIGDIALMTTEKYENGHPQVAQVAIQQADLLAKNLKRSQKGQALKAFKYTDKGSLATVGRNLAIADLPFVSFQGFFAWVLWLIVHLMSILGVKNRLFVFINWAWSYLTYDQSLRLLIKPKWSAGQEELEEVS